MLSPVEKVLFVIAVAVSLYLTYRGVRRIIGHISSGQGRPDWNLIWKRIDDLIVKVGLFQPVFRFRLGPSLLHAFIGWGLYIFLMVDLSELLYGMTGFRLLNQGGIVGDIYRLTADIANTAILVGIAGLVIRRFIARPKNLTTRESTLLHPKARPASAAIRPLWPPLSSSTTQRGCWASPSILRIPGCATAGSRSFQR